MKPLLIRLFSTFIIIGMVGFSSVQNIPVLYIIGDSTASDYSSSLYPRTGWGTTLDRHLNSDSVQVDNRALSGRSSKSFYEESGAWNKVIADLKAGDFLIIQFGHNDEKSNDLTRYTIPYSTYQEYLKKYIDEARAKGAFPILATSINRNSWTGTSIKDTHGDYPPAMRALAIEENVPLVDAFALTKTLFESLGQNYTTNEIFLNLAPGAFSNYPNGNSDNTHLQENGADTVSALVANTLSELSQTFNYLSPFDNGKPIIVSKFQLSLSALPAEGGTVTGNGEYEEGISTELAALAADGYEFLNWTENGQILGFDNPITITIADNRDIVANFQEVNILSVEDESFSININNGQISIKSKSIIDHLIIMDLSGRKLFETDHQNNVGIPTDRWNAGVYCIKWESLGKYGCDKFIVK